MFAVGTEDGILFMFWYYNADDNDCFLYLQIFIDIEIQQTIVPVDTKFQ